MSAGLYPVMFVNVHGDGEMFGRWIRQRRARRELTQEELADRAQLSVRTIQMLETGRVARPRPTTRRRLLETLGRDDEHLSETRPRQLPAGVHGFAGRHAELAALDAAMRLDPAPIVVVTGRPGIGKTSLAVHWAHRVAQHFDGGQLYVDLRGGDTDPLTAVRMCLSALGTPPVAVPASADEQISLYRTLLAGRRALIVLDAAHDAAQVRPLLAGAPGTLVVVTSRAPLTSLIAGYGARPLLLGPLPPPEARELLDRRIGAERTAAEPAATAEMIAGCAGLPLALSIVAARAAVTPSLPLSDLVAADRTGLLA